MAPQAIATGACSIDEVAHSGEPWGDVPFEDSENFTQLTNRGPCAPPAPLPPPLSPIVQRSVIVSGLDKESPHTVRSSTGVSLRGPSDLAARLQPLFPSFLTLTAAFLTSDTGAEKGALLLGIIIWSRACSGIQRRWKLRRRDNAYGTTKMLHLSLNAFCHESRAHAKPLCCVVDAK